MKNGMLVFEIPITESQLIQSSFKVLPSHILNLSNPIKLMKFILPKLCLPPISQFSNKNLWNFDSPSQNYQSSINLIMGQIQSLRIFLQRTERFSPNKSSQSWTKIKSKKTKSQKQSGVGQIAKKKGEKLTRWEIVLKL